MSESGAPIRVAVMGLGTIGRLIARAASKSDSLTMKAAVDVDPTLARKPLSELVRGGPAEVAVSSSLAQVLPNLKGGVLLHATGSSLERVLPELEAAVRAGVHVVSTCEQLAFPWLHHEALAQRLERLAIKHGVCILGTGVNPGFVLDRLVATAGGVCGEVRSVHAERVVDVRARRAALQRKVGLGLDPDEFERRVESGEIGHIGLAESAALAAIGLGLDYEEIEEEITPVLADEELPGDPPIARGKVAGLYQRARGFQEERVVVDLELTIAAGVDAAFDLIEIDATPPLKLRIEGGVAGDEATAWAVVNAAPRLLSAQPGLLTVLDLPAGR